MQSKPSSLSSIAIQFAILFDFPAPSSLSSIAIQFAILFDFPAPLTAPLARVSLAPSHSYQN